LELMHAVAIMASAMQMRSFTDGGRGLANDRGSIAVWMRAPILLAQMIGHGDGRFADPIIGAFDEALPRKLPVQIFFEMGGMPNYDSALRTRLTSHFASHRTQIASLHVFTRSRLVAMGVAVANLALGGVIISHESLVAFQAALDREIAKANVSGLSSSSLAR
jgi:hypothetical protein